jgi:F0F1-type ATP synthase membrane subunit c/vacuolar-type H+-ATPase subunit K
MHSAGGMHADRNLGMQAAAGGSWVHVWYWINLCVTMLIAGSSQQRLASQATEADGFQPAVLPMLFPSYLDDMCLHLLAPIAIPGRPL